MGIIDIHTHVLPEEPGTALVCIGCGPLLQEDGHWFSAGLHPWDVSERFDDQLRPLEALLANPVVRAVGECGFDTLGGTPRQLQEKAFVRQVELSEKFGKPMILHVVRDFDSVIRLHRELKPTLQWLIHGFRGAPRQMEQLLHQDLHISLGLHCNPETLKQIPESELFLETDGKCHIGDVIENAARVRSSSAETIRRTILGNCEMLLSGQAAALK